MAPETWLVKVKTALSHGINAVKSTAPNPAKLHNKKSSVGVLAFEIAGLMSKLLHLWQSLYDKNLVRLRNDLISLEGVRKIVSNDEAFLLGLACAEMIENLHNVAKSVKVIGKRCEDPNLRSFDRFLEDFANAGRDSNHWSLSSKDMELLTKKMDKYISATAMLHREIEELTVLENSLRKTKSMHLHEQHDWLSSPSLKSQQKIIDLQQKIIFQRQEIKCLKEKSIWNRSFDAVTSVLAMCVFTNLSRIKLVFGLVHQYTSVDPPSLPRSLSASAATVHPTENRNGFMSSGPLTSSEREEEEEEESGTTKSSFFESYTKLLKPPGTTLGAAALALHYANLIIVMEKMIKSPQLVGADARDDLYSMLPSSIRSALRARLRGVGFHASDPGLAQEWRDALGRILGWLSPLAHNMIKWQSERSFENNQNNGSLVRRPTTTTTTTATNVYLLQTLYFANKNKTEAAITELLVGLNYIWRFEREMTAKALFECTNFGSFLHQCA